MARKIIKLEFTTPVHFGNKRLSDAEMTIAADTLFSALYIENMKLGHNDEWLLNDLILSDTFPYQNNLLYLPKPLLQIRSKEEGNHKDFKKLKYIPVNFYKQYVQGDLQVEDIRDLNATFDIGEYHVRNKVSLAAQKYDPAADSEPYSVGIFVFNKEAGLYFVAEGCEETINKLDETLNSLQYSGLGGKRSAGYGLFKYQIIQDNNLDKLLNVQGEQHILLTTAMAEEKELPEVHPEARFNLKKRSGFIQSTNYSETLVKKNDFYSFAPGSVFPKVFKGNIFNVGEEGQHPVYRYAKPLWLEV